MKLLVFSCLVFSAGNVCVVLEVVLTRNSWDSAGVHMAAQHRQLKPFLINVVPVGTICDGVFFFQYLII